MLITKWRSEDGGVMWSIESGMRILRDLAWDEMLGTFARVALRECELPLPRVEWFDHAGEKYREVYSLRVTRIDAFHWTIEKGGAFCDHLTFDEMLGFLAKFTLTGECLFGGFLTYQQWSARPWARNFVPAALLN